jgi:hypothetical protein
VELPLARDYDYVEIARDQTLSKRRQVLPALTRISGDKAALKRVKDMASAIARRLDAINVASPTIDGKKTNPFVLAAHARKSSLAAPVELDLGLAAAKEFSGLETALGRIVEDIVPEVYGWEQVYSEAHSLLTEIDCAKVVGTVVRLAALKSGAACMNDTMVNKIGEAVAENYAEWADHWGVKAIDYTVGMNYSTGRNSNKKDWHAVRLAVPARIVTRARAWRTDASSSSVGSPCPSSALRVGQPPGSAASLVPAGAAASSRAFFHRYGSSSPTFAAGQVCTRSSTSVSHSLGLTSLATQVATSEYRMAVFSPANS